MSIDKWFHEPIGTILPLEKKEYLEFTHEFKRLKWIIEKQKETEKKIIEILKWVDIQIIFDDNGDWKAYINTNNPILWDIFELLDNIIPKNEIEDILLLEDIMLKYIIIFFKKYNNRHISIIWVSIVDNEKKQTD